jgi:transposase-like protein
VNPKQIERPRRRRNRAEVEQLVQEYEASGIGRQEFCNKHGLSLSTLNRHRKRKQQETEGAKPGRLIPVEISQPEQPDASQLRGELLVYLSTGRRIEVRSGFDAKMLHRLVRVLEQA